MPAHNATTAHACLSGDAGNDKLLGGTGSGRLLGGAGDDGTPAGDRSMPKRALATSHAATVTLPLQRAASGEILGADAGDYAGPAGSTAFDLLRDAQVGTLPPLIRKPNAPAAQPMALSHISQHALTWFKS